jgi:hypothetical protein
MNNKIINLDETKKIMTEIFHIFEVNELNKFEIEFIISEMYKMTKELDRQGVR